MVKKVIIDCDPGIDDAVALCIALLEPDVDVLAVTAVEGNATAAQTTRNVQGVIETLDPPKIPRIGAAIEGAASPPSNLMRCHGPDGLGGCGPALSMLHHTQTSDKLICDIVRSAPGEVTIITLGPLTNVARAFRRDPELPPLVGRLVMMAGSVDGIGNATPTAEFNVYFDPDSAREVFQSPANKTLIPLDMTRKLVFSLDMLNHLPQRGTRAGDLLHRMLAFAFRACRQTLGIEGVMLHDAVACVAAINPQLVHTTDMAGDVETKGELTVGATIFDRRGFGRVRPNMEVVTWLDESNAHELILHALRRIDRFD